MSGNPYSSPAKDGQTPPSYSVRRANHALASAALLFGIVSLGFAAFIRLSNGGWLVIACLILYAIVSVLHLTTIILAWKWDRSSWTSIFSIVGSILLFVAFFVQFDYGDGPSFISGLAFFDSDVESRNSMPESFMWASHTTNYLVFIPCLAAWITTIAWARRNRSCTVA